MAELTVEQYWGAVLARESTERQEHRWWFQTTDAGRLVFISDVIEYQGDEHADIAEGRHYHREANAEIPDRVTEQLFAEGYDMIVSTSGNVLHRS
jgi:hypothetical protein